MNQPIPDEADLLRAALDAAPHPTVAGVDRFAHFVVTRRADGELDRLGAGAMGITYRAFDTRLERLVALPPSRAMDLLSPRRWAVSSPMWTASRT
jgi:hypothetical protein